MTPQTDRGIHSRLQVMRLCGFSEQIDGDISGAMPRLVLQPADDAGPDMTGHTLHLFMRGLDPTLVGWLNGMAAGAELRMVGQRDRNSPYSQCAGHDRSEHNGRSLTHHPVGVWESVG